jgi:outer membrane protein assembly factor BamB
MATRGGTSNCNNVSSPALAGRYLHFGTMAGVYYVLDAATGKVVREIACGEPIFSAPAIGRDRVYFATLGTRVYAIGFDGSPCWTWDFLKEIVNFSGNRRRPGGRFGWTTSAAGRNSARWGWCPIVPATNMPLSSA